MSDEISRGPHTRPTTPLGPLAVSKTNPRYFAVASGGASEGRAVSLAGSHIWHNFHDGMGPGSECAATPEELDYPAYLDFLEERGHNLIRLWRWEQFRSHEQVQGMVARLQASREAHRTRSSGTT